MAATLMIGDLLTNNLPVVAPESDRAVVAQIVHEPQRPPAASAWQTPAPLNVTNPTLPVQRESGDQVNRFLLCALVSESAKRIKTRAAQTGETLPMAAIVRGVLRAYRVAAKDEHGPLSQATPDYAGLEGLNRKVLRDEITRHARDRVKTSEASLGRAKRFGDDAKVKAEADKLAHAIALRDRLAEEFC
jgi:hypothetical protein